MAIISYGQKNRNGIFKIYKIADKNTVNKIKRARTIKLPHKKLPHKKLPYKKLDIPKDQLWNAKKVNSELLQAIKSGENIDKISDRLMRVTDMNEVSAIRNARTMTTAFENMGRIKGMEDMSKTGVVVYKKWIATLDKHTRDTHRELNNEEAIPYNKSFHTADGVIKYPGDPSANPSLVYNCRCTLGVEVLGFKPTLPKGTILSVE